VSILDPFRRALRRRRDEAALVRSHRLLVDEALAAHRAGAPLPVVQTIYVGAHRATVSHRPVRVEARRLDRLESGDPR